MDSNQHDLGANAINYYLGGRPTYSFSRTVRDDKEGDEAGLGPTLALVTQIPQIALLWDPPLPSAVTAARGKDLINRSMTKLH